MRRYAALAGAIVAAMSVLFVVAEVLDVPYLADATPLDRENGVLPAALVGVGLLVADVFLPVPSSVVMFGHGALFGIVAGAALSMVGSVGAFALGFGLGRHGSAVVARLMTEAERQRADRILRRWGAVGIILSRPLPMVAETLSFVAGTSTLGWRAALAAAVVGSLPAAVLYAVAGAVATTFASTAVVFAVVVVLGLGAAVVLRPGGALSVSRRVDSRRVG